MKKDFVDTFRQKTKEKARESGLLRKCSETLDQKTEYIITHKIC